MNDIFSNPRAFAPMLEPVVWIEDAAPHRRGLINTAVFQGESQSTSAGPTLDGLTADPWTVKVPICEASVLRMKMGDALKLGPRFADQTLTVQQITATNRWFIIRATANERAPAP